MRPRSLRRSIGTLGAVAAALLVTASAVNAAQVYGKVGKLIVNDPGGVARQGSDGHLRVVRIDAPTIFGRYEEPTRVGWRFTVLHSLDKGRSWDVIHRSSVQKDLANESKAADNFSNRRWYPPDNATGVYKVRLSAEFYRPGSSTEREGRIDTRVNFWCNHFVSGDGYCSEIPTDDW